MSPGDALNAVAVFSSKTHFVSAQVLDETTTLYLTRSDFLSAAAKHPVVTSSLIALLGRVLNSAWERLTDFAGADAGRRVFNVLYMLYFKFGETVPVTRYEIADMAGTTPETTIRVLSGLTKIGAIDSRRGQITILNELKLREFGERSYFISWEDQPADRDPP